MSTMRPPSRPLWPNERRPYCPRCGQPMNRTECAWVCFKRECRNGSRPLAMKVYLAGRYSRRIELCGYREQLRSIGFYVQSRWLDGGHQISDTGTPIGDHGEALVESGGDGAAQLRHKFATDDFNDVCAADMVINFTEPPRSTANRGGRHVEFGIALALKKQVIVVGYRENIFHWLDRVEFYATWEELFTALGGYEK